MRFSRFAFVFYMFCLAVLPAWGDRLVTKDGRILEVRKARQQPDGTYELVFENGTIRCPPDQVKAVEIEGDMSDYVPKNEDERRKLEQGFVRYQGKWLSRVQYENLLKKQAEERRARTEELAQHSEFYNAYTRETKHFVVKTNTSPELLDYYCELLEAYYSLMDKRVGIKPTPKLRRTKMTVNIYKSRADWERNNEAGLGGGVVGYFSFIDQTLNFFHDYEDPEFSTWVGLHECTHLLTYLIEPQSWPRIWVNEGVADFFGSSDVTRDAKGRITIHPGKLQVDRVLTVQEAIKEGNYVPLEKLFRVEKASFGAFEYAHAWSFIYFLNNSKKQYEKGFRKFFKLFYTVPKGVEYSWEPFPNIQGTAKIIPPEEVRRILLQSLKVKDVAALEKEWLDFIASIEVDAPKALFKRAYLTVRRGDLDDFEQAGKDIDAAIEAGFSDPRAYWTRGLVKTWLGKRGVKGGIEDFRKAVELSPLNPSFRFSLGQALAGNRLELGGLSITVNEGDELFGSEEEFDDAVRQLGLACELDPENEFYRETFETILELLEEHEAGEGGAGR